MANVAAAASKLLSEKSSFWGSTTKGEARPSITGIHPRTSITEVLGDLPVALLVKDA